jgi:hypothetical protein
LCRSPLVEASRAHSSGVKRVPHAAAVTRPEIVFAWRPAAERASNAGAGGFEALILIGLAIQHYGRIVIGGCAHAPVIRALKGVRTRRACPRGVDFECGAVVPVDNVAGAEVAAQHFLDNTRATNANASLACLCTVFVMTNRIGMSGADLSPRSEVLRIALGTGGQDRGQTAYSHGLVSSLHNSLLRKHGHHQFSRSRLLSSFGRRQPVSDNGDV